MLEPFFGEISRRFPANKNCESAIKRSKDDFERDIMARLAAHDDQNCILDNFNRYKIHNLFMKGKIYYEHNKTAIKNFTNEAFESTTDLLRDIKKICAASDIYGKEFDESLKSREVSRPSATNQPTQNCLKKYFFEKKFLDSSEFGVDISSIDAIDCEEIWAEFNEFSPYDLDPVALVYGLPTISSQQCFYKKLESENQLMKLASFGVALLNDLNDELIKKLRGRFIETSANNQKFLFECLEKVLIVS